jgi:aryl-alcohol dehydrogenase-like predicted oxidoreductase
MMRYRKLGRTGISASELSFGSHLKKANIADPEGRQRQIRVGIDQGISLFDIYEHSYQQFEPMSAALAPVRDEVLISLVTVWRQAYEVAEEVEYALQVFKRQRIDLFRVVFAGDWQDSEERLEALCRAQQQGKVRAIGGVVHYPQHLLEAMRRFGDIVEFVMVPASFCAPLLIQEDQEIARTLRRHGAGVIAMKAMAAADQEGGYVHKLRPPGDELEQLRRQGLSLGRLAVKYLLQSTLVSTVLPAMNSVDEVMENAQACGGGALTGDEQRFLEIYREEAERVFPGMLGEDNYWVKPWQTEQADTP